MEELSYPDFFWWKQCFKYKYPALDPWWRLTGK
jgi:hypothetical protein